jgi:RND family efflux transporter MFP subunit
MAAAAALLGLGYLLYVRSRAGVNHVALASTPKLVTVDEAHADHFRLTHRYVGTIHAWTEARVGPQIISAYVETMLVRPGDAVKRGAVLATLDCRNASASLRAVSAQARALAATQAAVASEANRVSTLLDGGYASPNEVEQKKAESESKQAQLLAVQAQEIGSSLGVDDCVLKAPFDGEVAARDVDPGAFVRPGTALATLVDRSTARVVADVPEDDFRWLAPGTQVRVKLLSIDETREATITRRAPAADPATRTVHVEIDLPDPKRVIPVGTTADLEIGVGDEQSATRIPLTAATVRGGKASVFVVENDVVTKRSVATLGEKEGELFVATDLPDHALVVVEGRNALVDKDPVKAQRRTP